MSGFAEKRLELFNALIKHTCLVSSSLDPEVIMKRSITAATNLMMAETGSLLLLDQEDGEMYFEVALGEVGSRLKSLRLKRGEGIAGWVAERGEPVIVEDAPSDPRFFAEADRESGFKTRNIICVPVRAGGQMLGALQVINKRQGMFDDDDMDVLQALSNQVAVAIKNSKLFGELREAFTSTVEGLADIIEKRDPYTGGHTRRVRDYCLMIGKTMEFDHADLETLHLSAVLHDIGKIGVPDRVLHKDGVLSDEEFRLMSAHSAIGAEMLDRIVHLRPLVPHIKYHHEKIDSTGYPDSIGGEDIPLISRIICVADAFDAMTSNRPYRKGVAPQEAFDELRRCSGTQFDGEVVEAFFRAWRAAGLTLLENPAS